MEIKFVAAPSPNRGAGKKYLAEINSLRNELLVSTYKYMTRLESLFGTGKTFKSEGDYYKAEDTWADCKCELLLIDGRVVGLACIEFVYAKQLYLDTFVITEEFRGRGLGTKFMEYLFDKYLVKGKRERFNLACHGMNDAARRFYSKFGFVPTTIYYSGSTFTRDNALKN